MHVCTHACTHTHTHAGTEKGQHQLEAEAGKLKGRRNQRKSAGTGGRTVKRMRECKTVKRMRECKTVKMRELSLIHI